MSLYTRARCGCTGVIPSNSAISWKTQPSPQDRPRWAPGTCSRAWLSVLEALTDVFIAAPGSLDSLTRLNLTTGSGACCSWGESRRRQAKSGRGCVSQRPKVAACWIQGLLPGAQPWHPEDSVLAVWTWAIASQYDPHTWLLLQAGGASPPSLYYIMQLCGL